MKIGRSDLVIPWVVALAARIAMCLYVQTPTVLGDEVEYFVAARQPPGHPGLLSLPYPPLYPGLLSPCAVLGSRETAYLVCRILNALISSTVVPLTRSLWAPAGVWGGCFVGLLSSGVITSGLVLSENLFGPLLALWLLAAVRWSERRSTSTAVLMGLVASAAALTRAAGGAVVLASLVLMLRRSRVRTALAFWGALAPVVAYLIMRHLHPPQAFNDPLAVGHPPEIARAFVPNLHDLSNGTMLKPLAILLPWPLLFVALWFGFWCLQYVLYIFIGTAGLVAAVFHRSARMAEAISTRTPLLVVSVLSVMLAANHTLAGRQAEQFVRGRYVEPLLPLWWALAVGAVARGIRVRLTWRLLPLCCLAGIVPLTAAHNRATDFLYPLRSILLPLDPGPRWLIGTAAAMLAFLVGRTMLRSRGLYAIMIPTFVAMSLLASALRFDRQHDEAQRLAGPARWLAVEDPHGCVEIQTDGRPPDSLKASGLAWAVQQIRFLSDNPLCVAPDTTARYTLAVGGEGAICTSPVPSRPLVCLTVRE